jgi:hypothetical protein
MGDKALMGGLLGAAPALMGKIAGKENAGFGLGILPGLMYKDQYRDKQREKEAAQAAMKTAPSVAKATAKPGMKKGGKVKTMASGGSASKRADGCAQRGKTRGKIV